MLNVGYCINSRVVNAIDQYLPVFTGNYRCWYGKELYFYTIFDCSEHALTTQYWYFRACSLSVKHAVRSMLGKAWFGDSAHARSYKNVYVKSIFVNACIYAPSTDDLSCSERD